MIASFGDGKDETRGGDEAPREVPYADLFESSPFGMFVMDADGSIADCNAVFLRMAGAPRERVIGFDLLRSALDPALIPYLQRCLAGERVDFETPYTSTTGGVSGYYRYVFQPLEGRAGGPAVLAFVEDISARKAAELALQTARQELEQLVVERTARLLATENRYRALVEQSLAGVYVIQDGHIVYANPMMCQMFGYSPGEIAGLPTTQLVAPGDRRRVAASLRRRAAGRLGELRYGFRALRRTGEVFYVEVHGTRAELDGVPSVIGVIVDVSERHKLEEHLNHLAFYDPLTDLPNRKLFFDRLETLASVARRGGSRLAVLFVDLDGFKAVNDHHGHQVGDQVLARAAVLLVGCVRESDTVARLGGDEFAVILTHPGQREDVVRIARQIGRRIAGVALPDGRPAGISASIGISLCPDDCVAADELLKRADDAMYAAKAAGKATYRFAGQGRG